MTAGPDGEEFGVVDAVAHALDLFDAGHAGEPTYDPRGRTAQARAALRGIQEWAARQPGGVAIDIGALNSDPQVRAAYTVAYRDGRAEEAADREERLADHPRPFVARRKGMPPDSEPYAQGVEFADGTVVVWRPGRVAVFSDGRAEMERVAAENGDEWEVDWA